MSYFQRFPKIPYDYTGDRDLRVFTHLLKRVKVRALAKENTFNFDFYDVQDGESPEMIAHKYYGDAGLHWTILIANDIQDYYTDWPMSVARFEQFLIDKYGNSIYDIHHYEIEQLSGKTTKTIDIGSDNTGHPSAVTVSNYEYESTLQDQKRQIRLIDPKYIYDFIAEFEELITEGA
jgi:hypothetical protein